MKYIEYKEDDKEILTFKQTILEEKENLIKVVIYNFLMLAFGYLGESGKINKKISVGIGFIFFYLSFKTIYIYAEKTQNKTSIWTGHVLTWRTRAARILKIGA